MTNGFERVAGLSDLREGDPLGVQTASGEEAVLVKIGSSVYAIAAICTHQEAWLDMGLVIPESLELQCPLHEGRFNLQTGEATALPATDPIKTYPVRIEGNDILISLG